MKEGDEGRTMNSSEQGAMRKASLPRREIPRRETTQAKPPTGMRIWKFTMFWSFLVFFGYLVSPHSFPSAPGHCLCRL